MTAAVGPSNQRYVGPLAPANKPKIRDHNRFFSHQLNETPSERSRMDALVGEALGKSKLILQEGGVEFLQDEAKLITQYRPAIQDSAQKRVAAFFQQLILAYRSQLHFEVGFTFVQAESATTRFFTDPTQRKDFALKQDATHTSTIPCLYAYHLSAWESYEQRLSPKPQGFIFMEGSEGYRFWNSTIELPSFFNKSVDLSIDQNKGNLQGQGIAILNRAAKGEITPEDGLKLFVDQFIATLQRVKADKYNRDKTAKRLGLQFYEEEFDKIRCCLTDHPNSSFERYLNIQVDPLDAAPNVRRTIFQIRYNAIQENFTKQSHLAQQIETVRKSIQSVSNFREGAFRDLLIESMPNDPDKKRVGKFFSTPYHLRDTEIRTQEKEIFKKKLTVTQFRASSTELVTGLQIIQSLALYLSQEMGKMRQREVELRGETMEKIRYLRNFSRRALSSEMKRACPTFPSSESTIYRSEKGIRVVDAAYAVAISRVFKVDPGLFMPQFFNS